MSVEKKRGRRGLEHLPGAVSQTARCGVGCGEAKGSAVPQFFFFAPGWLGGSPKWGPVKVRAGVPAESDRTGLVACLVSADLLQVRRVCTERESPRLSVCPSVRPGLNLPACFPPRLFWTARPRLRPMPTSRHTSSVATRTYLFGDPIATSLSIVFHNACYAARDMSSTHVHSRIESADVDTFMETVQREDCGGSAVTMPNKVSVLSRPEVKEVEEQARMIGACNTLYWKKGPGGERFLVAANVSVREQTDRKWRPADSIVLLRRTLPVFETRFAPLLRPQK